MSQIDNERRAKELIDNVLQNTHESLKWSWQIVMGFALVSAVQETYQTTFASGSLSLEYESLFTWLVFLLGFLPAFVRFFYGDNRYLDLHYHELRQWNDSGSYIRDLKHLSMKRRIVDSLLLLTHGIVFVFMAKSIGHPWTFFGIYMILMITNLLWLSVTVTLNRTIAESPRSQVKNLLVGVDRFSMESPRRDRAPKFWIKNNLTALLLFLLVWLALHKVSDFYTLPDDVILFFWLGVCIFNSSRDLWKQRKFYWPSLEDVYKEALSE